MRRHPLAAAALAVGAAVAVLVAVWDWNWFKSPLEQFVERRTGRTFDIGGDLDVDLGWTPVVSAERVRFGNAAWAREPTMASADRVEFAIELPPLLRRDVRVPDLRLHRPVLNLEIGPQRRGNWRFGPGGDGEGPRFRRLYIEQGRLAFLDAAHGTDIRVDLSSQRAGQRAGPVVIEGGGRWRGNRFEVRGVAQSPLALRERNSPYRIDLEASAGATRAHARGTLLDPVRLRGFDLHLLLRGSNAADLYPLIGIALPDTPPYRLEGRFRREDATWRFDRFTGTVGDSDVAGSIRIETAGARPFFKADLVSRRIDFDDLAGFVGGAPQTGSGETTNAELAARAARARARAARYAVRPRKAACDECRRALESAASRHGKAAARSHGCAPEAPGRRAHARTAELRCSRRHDPRDDPHGCP
jgi:uncharacterized protein involved in outer membrane biogenesis